MNLTDQKLALVLEANRAISSTLNTQELLRQVMSLATRVVDAETSSILLYDEKTDELYFDLALGEKEAELKRIRLKASEGIAGWVAKNKQTQIINDVSADTRWAKQADSTTKFHTRSVIAVPIIYRGSLLGVVEAINKVTGIFSADDAAILEAFAAQAAVSIENARIFENLRESKEKAETVFAQMMDGAVFVDDEGKKILVNGAAAKLLGNEAARKETIFDIFEGFAAEPSINSILSATDKCVEFELTRKISKTLYLGGTVTGILNSAGAVIGYLFIFRDVTPEKQESLVKKNFLSLISHKLKTPLVVITGYGPLLLDDPSLGEFQKKAVSSITKQGKYLLSLVEKLLNFTMIDEGVIEIEKVESRLAELVERALASLRQYIDNSGADITVKEDVKALPPVMLDDVKAEAALKNIIENAIKFHAEEKIKVEIGAVSSDECVGVYVKDNGPGIPPEEREKIFQKFYQVEESFTGQVEGAGLGLALAKQVMEAHGGKVTLESGLGYGSTFSLLFPG